MQTKSLVKKATFSSRETITAGKHAQSRDFLKTLKKFGRHKSARIHTPAQPYAKIPAWKRCELLPKYLRATRAALFVDDAHKLTGRKLVIAKECIDRAHRVVLACNDENRLSPSIRRPFLETKPQEIRLTSEVAYDATHVLVWLFVALAMFAGSPELAALIGVFELMKGGRRASKQD